MKLKFCGNIEELKDGIAVLSDRLGIFESKAGLKLRVEKVTENKIEVIKNSEEAVIRYRDKVHFFRALGLFMEKAWNRMRFRLWNIHSSVRTVLCLISRRIMLLPV